MSDQTETETNGTPEQRTVPYDRFHAQVRARTDAEARIADLQAQVDKLTATASTADTLAQQLEKATSALEEQKTAHTHDMALVGAGLTSQEGRDLARWWHGRIEGDKPDLVEWVGSLSAEGAEIPAALQPYLGGQAETQQQTQQQTQTKLPRDSSKRPGAATSPSTYTREQIAAMGKDGTLMDNLPQILASIREGR